MGDSYLSSQDPRLHFGLGTAERVAAVTVRVAGEVVAEATDVAANRILTIGVQDP